MYVRLLGSGWNNDHFGVAQGVVQPSVALVVVRGLVEIIVGRLHCFSLAPSAHKNNTQHEKEKNKNISFSLSLSLFLFIGDSYPSDSLFTGRRIHLFNKVYHLLNKFSRTIFRIADCVVGIGQHITSSSHDSTQSFGQV